MLPTAQVLRDHSPLELGGGLVRLPFPPPKPPFATTLLSPAKIFTLPLAQVAFMLRPQGLIPDAVARLGLKRLADISQLQYLTFLKVSGPADAPTDAHAFPHTRYEHSLGVAALMGLMLRGNGVTGPDAKVALLTALVHDSVTSAGGDAIKNVRQDQPDLFCEDANINYLFESRRDGWRSLTRHYSLPDTARQDIEHAVRTGSGLAGSLMEIADTSCYLALDLKHLRERLTAASPRIYVDILDFAERTRACRLWETIVIENDRAVVTDPDRLEQFLTLRAFLWRHLYHDPTNKLVEFLLTEIVFPELFAQRAIERKKLFQWGDAQLNAQVAKLLGVKDFARLNLLGAWPEHRTFGTWEEALVEENRRVVCGGFTVIRDLRDMKTPTAKTALYRVPTATGPQTFEAAFPDRALRIQRILAPQPDPVQLFWVPNGARKLAPAFDRAWSKARAKWRKRRG